MGLVQVLLLFALGLKQPIFHTDRENTQLTLCPLPVLDSSDTSELGDIRDGANENPPATSGFLPPSANGNGAHFAIASDGYGVISLKIDGVNVTSPVLDPLSVLQPLNREEQSAVQGLVREWTACATGTGPLVGLTSLFTRHGLTWLYAPDDPFFNKESPAASITTLSVARTEGSLPLLLLDSGKLSDGRLAVLVGEGSVLPSAAAGANFPASLWLLLNVDGELAIDGIVGGFEKIDTDFVRI